MNPQTKTTPINIRAQQDQRNLIDEAARVAGMSRTDFILSASCEKATETLLDRRLLIVSETVFDDIDRILSMPLSANAGYQRLMGDEFKW